MAEERRLVMNLFAARTGLTELGAITDPGDSRSLLAWFVATMLGAKVAPL
jgi:hypothetical protein